MFLIYTASSYLQHTTYNRLKHHDKQLQIVCTASETHTKICMLLTSPQQDLCGWLSDWALKLTSQPADNQCSESTYPGSLYLRAPSGSFCSNLIIAMAMGTRRISSSSAYLAWASLWISSLFTCTCTQWQWRRPWDHSCTFCRKVSSSFGGGGGGGDRVEGGLFSCWS